MEAKSQLLQGNIMRKINKGQEIGRNSQVVLFKSHTIANHQE